MRRSVWRGWVQPRNTWQARRPPFHYWNRARIKCYLPVPRYCMSKLCVHRIAKCRHWVLEIGGEIRGMEGNIRRGQVSSWTIATVEGGIKNKIGTYVLLGKLEGKRQLGRPLEDLTVPPQHPPTDPYRCVHLTMVLTLILLTWRKWWANNASK